MEFKSHVSVDIKLSDDEKKTISETYDILEDILNTTYKNFPEDVYSVNIRSKKIALIKIHAVCDCLRDFF